MKTLNGFWRTWLFIFALVIGGVLATIAQEPSFINWETAPIHPVALSPDGKTLVVCNLPDNRIEIFNVEAGAPINQGNVQVGLDPVSVRFRSNNEVWVVNHISSSVSVVDLSQQMVTATIQTLHGPADIVFAGSPQKAFVSCAKVNTIQVYDSATHAVITNVVVHAERPKGLAVSPDGNTVYAAVFESGNNTTILAPKMTTITLAPSSSAVDNTNGPYGGQNPPPNSGNSFSPLVNPNLPEPPSVSHIVRKNSASRWLDDNNRDWTEFVSGTNAAVSRRIQGWDMSDYDLVMLDTSSFAVSYVRGLMNICMNVAVNPVSGMVSVIGTEATNERRFEPNLQGRFLRVNLALVNPTNQSKSIIDLNSHLNYAIGNVQIPLRERSIGDPRDMVWNSTGTRAYITGMGSRNLIVVDAEGNRVTTNPIELGEGPTGIVFDDARARLYVLNRFSASLSVVGTISHQVITNVPFYDPTPAAIKMGRKHLYDTRKNSGLGHTACASCHVDARMDRLAWDLGSPMDGMQLITNANIIEGFIRQKPHTNNPGNIDNTYFFRTNYISPTLSFHPMKGPMLTQTFQDIIGHEPFHWRGDRQGIEQFNRTFIDLLGADQLLNSQEMREFKHLLSTIHFPPNPNRNFDNSLATNVALPSGWDYGGGQGYYYTNGNPTHAASTLNFLNCMECHTFPTGLGTHLYYKTVYDFEGVARRLTFSSTIPEGTEGEQHLAQVITPSHEGRAFKVAHLRNLQERVGFDLSSTNSQAGFGYLHDGRVDTLSNLLQDGFLTGEEAAADVIAMLFSFTGSGFREGLLDSPQHPANLIGPPGKDVPAAVGRQITLSAAPHPDLLPAMLALANSPTSRVDLVVKGLKDGVPRGWMFNRANGKFQSDRNGETITPEGLVALAAVGNELTYTVVPRGSGVRIGLDRDGDGHFDRTELDFNSDPADPLSNSLEVLGITTAGGSVTITWKAVAGKTYRVLYKNGLGDATWTALVGDVTTNSTTGSKQDVSGGTQQRFYYIQAVE